MIHQNEVRKAKKLAELTHKLELEDDGTVGAAEETVPVPLCLVMPMNQLTSHIPKSPSSPASAAVAAHADQSPTKTDDSPDTRNGQAAVSLHVSSDGGCETAASSASAPQTTDTTEAVKTVDSNSAVPSTSADDSAV